jgi:hypothetical protein
MSKTTKSDTQERLRKEKAEQLAKMAKQKADRLAAEAKKTDELEQHAKRVAALYKSMREFEAHAEEKAGFELKKAAEKRAALEQALVEARELCKAAGENFKAFQEKYAPNYKRTRLYQVLAIADGRKTAEGIREEEREKKRRQRAGKVSGTGGNVPDKAAEGEALSAKAALKSGEERDWDAEPAPKQKPATKPAGAPEPAVAPVSAASAERPIEQVKAAGAALADEDEAVAKDDLSIPDFMRRTAGEAPPPAEPATNGQADDGGEAFHIGLSKALNTAIALCGVAESWPEMSAKDRNRRDKAVNELRALTHALVALATPKSSKLH